MCLKFYFGALNEEGYIDKNCKLICYFIALLISWDSKVNMFFMEVELEYMGISTLSPHMY